MMEDTAPARVDHRRVDDDAVDFGRFKNSQQVRPRPREGRQWPKVVGSRAE
jgi:hypothetical protein